MVWKIVLNVKSKIPTQATTKIKLKLVKHLDWYNMPNPDHTSVTHFEFCYQSEDIKDFNHHRHRLSALCQGRFFISIKTNKNVTD